ncbi:hypothetical protein [Fusibacter tunisiensis]|uniref:DNA phosphorothioation-dependent restriction protein DptF n=1 Tax=Fusibacter tunisiensis TaxID=1008308 RepID=A0ABS2MT73_9FIRM|nr:hypothetical protein [Fusibacter tunisiensis]MBM7562606.1 hypothetical protein [Fusibacter tunisiensis]
MNDFVKYLNSMNSAKSESKNALAESQLMEEYYSRIEVKREISSKITSYLKKNEGIENEAIILTGHAGDGKTSILIQVLEEFGYFEGGKRPLKIEEEYNGLYYIKDMSELSEDQQKNLLMKFLSCKDYGMSSIIVSNTGPIINTFKALFNDEVSNIEIEQKILAGINNVISDPITISSKGKSFKFRMVNIANIDNAYMIEQILLKVLNKELWKECFVCENCCKCPINNNYDMVSENIDDVADKISKIYFWLSERGSRLTIRQMLAHITFSLTSNLECEKINNFDDSETMKNKYSFVNGFFGAYHDKTLRDNALNIKPIKELSLLGLDQKSFGKFDDELFIKESYNVFPEMIKERVIKVIKATGEGISDNTYVASMLRNEIRRYFILFAKDALNQIEIENTIISEPFMDYYRAVANDSAYTKAVHRKLEKVVFDALYRYFIGVYPSKTEENLYVTLRKDFNVVQNTQMLIAKVPRDDISIVLEEKEDKAEPEKIDNRMFLKIGNKGKFLITSEFLEYMFKFYEGNVFTNLQPSFSYGISKLKTQIMREYKVRDKEKLTLIIIQNEKIGKMKIEVDEEEGQLIIT